MRAFVLSIVTVGIFILVSFHSLAGGQASTEPEIVLVTPNLDDDDLDGKSDADDTCINGERDREDLTPIEVPISLLDNKPVLEGPGAELYRVVTIEASGDSSATVFVEAKGTRSDTSSAVLRFADKDLNDVGLAVSLDVRPFIVHCSIAAPVSEVFVADFPLHTVPFIRHLEQIFSDIPNAPKLTIVSDPNKGVDIWTQDSTEIGGFSGSSISAAIMGLRDKQEWKDYQGPHPRNMDRIFMEVFKGPDRCGLKIGESLPDREWIDWFGNLEVTPPCIGPDGRKYPLGRILTGRQNTLSLHPAVMEFLKAQNVQWPPVILDTSFLFIGHIDEVINFCPAGNGYKVLLPSPVLGRQLLEDLAAKGHGDGFILEGKNDEYQSWETTVGKVLANEDLMKQNDAAAEIMAANREVLKREMSLDEAAIIDLPLVFFKGSGGPLPAGPLWPSPINGLWVGKHYILSAPHGPKIDGTDVIEQCYRDAFEGTGVVLHFIDVFDGYSRYGGDIHCGTNAIRHRAPSSCLSD